MFKPRNLALAGIILVGVASISSAAGADTSAATLSKADRSDIARIEIYLNNLTTMESRFLQFSEQGMAQGRIFLERPGHLRIEYTPPTPILAIGL